MHFGYSLNAHKIHFGCIWMQKKLSTNQDICVTKLKISSNDTVVKKSKILKNSQKFLKNSQNVIKMSQKFSNRLFLVEKIKISQKFSKILKKCSKSSQKFSNVPQKCFKNATQQCFFQHGNGLELNVTSIWKDIQCTISFCTKKSKVLKSSQKKSRVSRVSTKMFGWCPLRRSLHARVRALACVRIRANEHCNQN